MAPAIAADAKIPCNTPHQLREEVDTLVWALEPEEKEDTWEKFERAIIRFAAVTRGGGYKMTDQFVEGVGRKGVGPKLAKCMLSDRGRLSGVSTDLLQTMAPRLSLNFKPLVNLYLEPLVTLLGRPNKVFLKRAEKCLSTIISHCHLITILPELRTGLSDNATTCRRYCASGIERMIKEWPKEIWSEKALTILEECVKKMATDKDPEARQTGKRVWALFNQIWPERVEDFSAPLTPTVRRYLGVPANGEPAKNKGKAPTRPAAPPLANLRVTSAASSESSHASGTNPSEPATKPQHHRVNALASRPARGAIAPIAPVEAGPSRRKSPRKEPETRPAQMEPDEDNNGIAPTLARSASSGPSRHHHHFEPLALGALSHHGRSISHNILLSAHSLAFSSDEQPRHNPLSRPVRPVLPTYQSAPVELGEAPMPPRRFAPPARIVRPTGVEEDGPDGYFDLNNGAVLKGPSRNPISAMARRPAPLGNAHRRIITAPMAITEEAQSAPLPGTSKHASASSRHNEQQLDKHDHNREHEHSPINEDRQAQPGVHLDKAFNSPAPTHVMAMDSPLMPTLIRSESGNVQAEETGDADSNDMIDLEEDVYPPSPSAQVNEADAEVAAGIQLPESPVKIFKELKHVEEPQLEHEQEEFNQREDGEDAHAQQVAESKETPTEKVFEVPQMIVVHGNSAAVDGVEAPSDVVAAQREDQGDVKDATSEIQASQTAGPSGTTSADAREISAKPAPIKHVAQPVMSVKEAPKPVAAKPRVVGVGTAAVARKPPVPTARGGTFRAVSAPISRKPFKPTSLTAPTAASAARSASITKPVPAPAVVSNPTVATSTAGKAASTASTSTTATKIHAANSISAGSGRPPIPMGSGRARVVSAQIAPKPEKIEPKPANKPPIPPMARAAPTRVVSGPRKPAVTSQVTLPPVKKERVVRKAPLPSFRPTRGIAVTTDKPTAGGSTNLKASTSSVVSAGGRARVKPEMIRLPDSPAHVKAAEIALPPSPHEVPLPSSPLMAAKTNTVVSSASKHRSSPLKVEIIRPRVRADSMLSNPNSPITLAPPKPLSPLLTTVETEEQQAELPKPPVFGLPTKEADGSELQPMGLAPMSSDPFSSVSATPLSKASTDTDTSEVGNTSAFSDSDDECIRVTFKSRSPVPASTSASASIHSRTASPVRSIASVAPSTKEREDDTSSTKMVKTSVNAFAPRSDVSTPRKSAAVLLAKLEGSDKGMNMAMSFTPVQGERKALRVKDANTPGALVSSSESEWDVSA